MDKRISNMLEMERNENRYSNSAVTVPPCISTDYCVQSHKDMNGGILTMAFVDMQPLESVYPPETAFCSGTLFPNINKPFFGGNIR